MSLQEDSTSKMSDAKTEKDNIKVVSHEEEIEIVFGNDIDVPNNEDTQGSENKIKDTDIYEMLKKVTIRGDWLNLEFMLKKVKGLATEAINSDGSTILHLAVGIGHNDMVKSLFSYINEEEVLIQRESDGSTALHIAAIVGNKDAAELLVKKNSKLLQIKDCNGEQPLHKAYENMHLDTIGYLLKAVSDDANAELQSPLHPDDNIGVDLLVNAISAKQYTLASELIQFFPKFASKSDDVLMAIAKTFPRRLNYGEAFIYPSASLDNILRGMLITVMVSRYNLLYVPNLIYAYFCCRNGKKSIGIFYLLTVVVFWTVPCILSVGFLLIWLLILITRYLFLQLYSLWWNGAKILFAPIKHIDSKKNEWDEAKKVLELVCDEIDKLDYSSTHHSHYTQPILEAACQNAYDVVDEILLRSPEAIQSKDKNGYDIIQLAIINRSEKIYNLIYDIGERKNLYRTYKDSSKNNILHLAGKLAPSSVLNQRTGAALQLQRELQWYEEVKKLVFPAYSTQENIFKETPGVIFAREHHDLLKEGEQWMKTTAESCSITAALIITIIFAAAITVPGGSNQEQGTPLFKKETAFIIFAISDAISLFASSTSLLVFLSILTARFSEKDFLVNLPSRLFIGLFSLLLSTTAMMVAFSATLFLVFCDKKPWMLVPICGLAFIPVASFITLQFPLLVDLFKSTYLSIFGKQRKGNLPRFNPADIRLLFGK